MSGKHHHEHDEAHDRKVADEVLKAFGAEELYEDPGEPAEDLAEPASPASDADAPAPN